MRRIQVLLLKLPKESLNWLLCIGQNTQKINPDFREGEFTTLYTTMPSMAKPILYLF
jgi:hypothetical protein